MPTYIYRDDEGVAVEIAMSISEMERREREDGTIEHEGRVLRRDVAAEHSGPAALGTGWPLLSESCGVHPSQKNEFRKLAEERGTRIDFSKDGRAIFESRSHRADYMRRMGYFDKDAGYADATRP